MPKKVRYWMCMQMRCNTAINLYQSLFSSESPATVIRISLLLHQSGAGTSIWIAFSKSPIDYSWYEITGIKKLSLSIEFLGSYTLSSETV